MYLGFKLILFPSVLCPRNLTKSSKQVETLPFPCFSFSPSQSVKYYPMTFHWLASIKAMDFLFLNQSQVTVQE